MLALPYYYTAGVGRVQPVEWLAVLAKEAAEMRRETAFDHIETGLLSRFFYFL